MQLSYILWKEIPLEIEFFEFVFIVTVWIVVGNSQHNLELQKCLSKYKALVFGKSQSGEHLSTNLRKTGEGGSGK